MHLRALQACCEENYFSVTDILSPLSLSLSLSLAIIRSPSRGQATTICQYQQENVNIPDTTKMNKLGKLNIWTTFFGRKKPMSLFFKRGPNIKILGQLFRIWWSKKNGGEHNEGGGKYIMFDGTWAKINLRYPPFKSVLLYKNVPSKGVLFQNCVSQKVLNYEELSSAPEQGALTIRDSLKKTKSEPQNQTH